MAKTSTTEDLRSKLLALDRDGRWAFRGEHAVFDTSTQMGTSRSSLDRLLDPSVPSVTLLTIEKAARVLGKRVRIEMVEADAAR
jgi:hypothetical protein